MLPYELSLNADSERTSSTPLELCTSTAYLTVAQPAARLSTLLVVVAVLGASEDVTVTLLDWVLVKVELLLRDEWPDALTVSVKPTRFSPTGAVKVHVSVAPGAIPVLPPGGQLTLVAVMPLFPAGQVAGLKAE